MNDRSQANAEALQQLVTAEPVWVGVKRAGDVIPGLANNQLLHAGPPLQDRPQPLMRRALAGALVFEGNAQTLEEGLAIVDAGDMHLSSCNDYQTVGPLAGVVSPSMPVIVVRTDGVEAYAPLNEGAGCVLRYGCVNDDVIAHLHFLKSRVAVLLDNLITSMDAIPVFDLASTALHMGDECHHRFKAIQMALALLLTERMDQLDWPLEDRRVVRSAILDNDFFALNLVMAAGKAATLSAEGVPGSSLITVIARNGNETGIRVSGLQDRWFTAPVEAVDAVFIEPYGPSDANPDTGDSCIVEINGLGGCALPAAPSLARWFGGTPEALIQLVDEMYRITLGEHPKFTVPWLGYRGTPVGIDCYKILEEGISPITETLQTAREHAPGAVAIGISRVPMQAIQEAVDMLEKIDIDKAKSYDLD